MSHLRVIFRGRRPIATPLPPRFTPIDWSRNSAQTHYEAENEREKAERLLAESLRVTDETREISEKAQLDVDWKFNQRLKDIEQWKDELEKKFGDVSEEIDDLSIFLQRVGNSLSSHDPIVGANNQVLQLREGRMGIDLVNDSPQEELLKEVKIIQRNQSELTKTGELCKEQLRILRKCAYNLDKELKDKAAALEIDKLALGLDEHRSVVKSQYATDFSHVSNEEEWEVFTRRHKLAAETALKASQRLRTNIDSLLRRVCEDLQTQVCLTNAALEKRLRECIDAKAKLEFQHAEITIKVREMQDTIDILKKAFEGRKSSSALAETRLNIRARRPNLELVNDDVHKRLLLEVREMYATMENINRKHTEANALLKNLQRRQLELEEAINIKVNTIEIEETRVLPVRRTISVEKH